MSNCKKRNGDDDDDDMKKKNTVYSYDRLGFEIGNRAIGGVNSGSRSDNSTFMHSFF
jgi:hypothetical protein